MLMMKKIICRGCDMVMFVRQGFEACSDFLDL